VRGRAADDEPAVCAWGRGRKKLCVHSTTYLRFFHSTKC